MAAAATAAATAAEAPVAEATAAATAAEVPAAAAEAEATVVEAPAAVATEAAPVAATAAEVPAAVVTAAVPVVATAAEVPVEARPEAEGSRLPGPVAGTNRLKAQDTNKTRVIKTIIEEVTPEGRVLSSMIESETKKHFY